jgi:hypothetical protein
VWPLPQLGDRRPALARLAADHVELGYDPMPDRDVPVLAAHDGVIIYADARTVALDHAGGFSTQYGNLHGTRIRPTDRFRRRRKERVRAGDVLGFATALRFTLAQLDHDDLVPIDPTERMTRWQVVTV